MLKLTLFEALFLTHFIADWLFQTQWEALNKSKQFLPLFIHSLCYTLLFIPVLYFYQLNVYSLLLLFATHLILDNRKFENWWIKVIKQTRKENIGENLWLILTIVVDQVFHLLVLGVIVLLH